MNKPVIGILGAGKLGMTLAKLAVDAGYKVYISGSREPQKIELSVDVLAKGANPEWTDKVIEYSDVIILAMPLNKYKNINSDLLANKLVIDSMNYWWEVDGNENTYYSGKQTSTEAVAEYFNKSKVIKALNHMGYHDLASEANASERKSIAYAGNNSSSLKIVDKIIEDFGFDALYLGDLSKGVVLQPSKALFGVNKTKAGLLELLSNK